MWLLSKGLRWTHISGRPSTGFCRRCPFRSAAFLEQIFVFHCYLQVYLNALNWTQVLKGECHSSDALTNFLPSVGQSLPGFLLRSTIMFWTSVVVLTEWRFQIPTTGGQSVLVACSIQVTHGIAWKWADQSLFWALIFSKARLSWSWWLCFTCQWQICFQPSKAFWMSRDGEPKVEEVYISDFPIAAKFLNLP